MKTDVFPLSEVIFAVVANGTLGTGVRGMNLADVVHEAGQLYPDREWNPRTVSWVLQRGLKAGWYTRNKARYSVAPEHIVQFWNDRARWMDYLNPEVLSHVKKM